MYTFCIFAIGVVVGIVAVILLIRSPIDSGIFEEIKKINW